MTTSPDLTLVSRLRVRGPGLDASSTALRAASMLRSADIRPPGMPPSATLIVRRLVDPAPRRLRLVSGAAVSRAWEQAARESMAGLYRHAAGSANGAIPPDAEAVLFLDEAELLAHLAMDLRDGVASGRWWWQHRLRGRQPGVDSLAHLMLAEAPSVPAMLAYLSRRGEANSVVLALSKEQAAAVLQSLVKAYELPGVLTQLYDILPAPRPRLNLQDDTSSGEGATTLSLPWSRWLQPATGIDSGLAPAQAVLLGVASALHRAPHVARSTAFADDVLRWVAQRSADYVADQTVPTPKFVSRAHAAPEPVHPSFESHREVIRADERQQPLIDLGPPREGTFLEATSHLPTEAETRASQPVGPEADQPAALLQRSHPASANVPPTFPDAIEADSGIEPGKPYDGLEGISTALGGIFFLVNLMVYLEIPAVFETDWHLESGVSPWEVLELLARALLVTTPEDGLSLKDIARDPAWGILAQISGREPDRPLGEGIASGQSTRLPDAWLADDVQSASMAPLAFNVLTGPLLGNISEGAQHWLALVLPFIRRRLGSALGIANALGELESALLLRYARIFVSSMHIDVVMPLESISLPVRLAGLDRDPGWLPGFGRVIKLYYE